MCKTKKYLFHSVFPILFLSFISACSVNAQSAEDYFNRGLEKVNLKDYSGSVTEYSKAIALDPEYVKAYIHRGISRYEQEEYSAAISDYNINYS